MLLFDSNNIFYLLLLEQNTMRGAIVEWTLSDLCAIAASRCFVYTEKDQECWTAAANSKTEMILRRRSSSLYEKNSEFNTVIIDVYQEFILDLS